MAKKIRKSAKFDNAYTIKGMKGHFFLQDIEVINHDVHIPHMVYDHKWLNDTHIMELPDFIGLLYMDLGLAPTEVVAEE